MVIDSPIVSGSYNGTGSFQQRGNVVISGSLTVTGPVIGSLTGSVDSASFATTSLTSSFANNFTVAGQLIAQTINVQTITSSVDFVTGSTRFGSLLSNTHQFTGSVGITGSLSVNGVSAVTGTGTSGQVAYFNATSGVTGESNLFWDAANDRLGIGTPTPAYRLEVAGTVGLNTNGNGELAVFGANTANDKYITVKNSGGDLYLGTSSTANYLWGVANLPLLFYTNNSPRMTLDSSGNLGLGVQPSAWNAAAKAIDINSGSLYAFSANIALAVNGFFDTGWKYKGSGHATLYNQSSGQHEWYTASSGTAGNAITFTQAMTLDASGRLGIGTATPANRLHVSVASSGVSPRTDLGGTIIAEGSTRAGLYILTSGTAAGSYGSIWFGNGNTNTDGSIVVRNDTRAMEFGTADGLRMTLNASGNLGLGVTPSAWSVIQAMQVLNTSWGASPNNLISYQSSNVFFDGAFKYITNGTATQYRINDSGVFSWLIAPSGTAGNVITFSQAMTLDASGNLLVRTTTNPYGIGSLVVNHNSTSTRSYFQRGVDLIEIAPSDGTLANLISSSFTIAGSAYKPLSISARQNYSDLHLTTDGRMGIGTISPSDRFTVTDASTYTFNIGAASGGAGAVLYTLGSAALTFATNGSTNERMRITSGGNVGIGTTDPSQRLTINNTADNTTLLLTTVNGNGRHIFSTDSSANARIRTGNNVDLRLGVNEDAIVIRNGGNVLVGTTTDNGNRLQVNGAGTFSSSVTAGQYRTAGGNTGVINSGVATTIFTFPAGFALYQVIAQVPGGGGSPTVYSSFADIIVDGTGAARISANNASLLSITLSGQNVQVTQGSGVATSVDWYFIKIG